jgi:asparagine synthase (glutamine-hydrolysing)
MMARRGPDDKGQWSDDLCALGFRRLAILDLSPTGHQPMLTADGRFALVFNGEVYNYAELRARLTACGVRFRSTGDSEVVLYALAMWGVAALEQFNGMFALALYDRAEHRLLLARDHAGIKPLFYLHTGRSVVFASQFDQILQHPWSAGLPIAPEALAHYLRFGSIPAPLALLKQTYQVEPGGWVLFDSSGEVTSGRFFVFPRYQEPTLRGEEATAALEDALQRAVERHLASDVPLGVFLSGGIDSPLVAAEAVRHVPCLKAFSIGISNSEHDESEDARRYAEELGLEHIVHMITPNDALDLLDDAVAAYGEPNADYSIFPTLLVSRLAREHVTVALSGDGGDELFWGYPSRFGSVLEQTPYFRLPLPARYAAIAARRLLGRGKATGEALFPNIGALYRKKHTLMAESDLRVCLPGLPALPDEPDLFNYTGTTPDETAQWLRWNELYLHLAAILAKVDRASMHHSLEVRVPLLDREVIDVARHIDWRSCLDVPRRYGKLPLRRMLARRVQHQTVAKKGFTVPMDTWLTGSLRDLLHDQVLGRNELMGVSLKRTQLGKMFQALERGDRSKARGLWMLLSLALWRERHFRQRSRPQVDAFSAFDSHHDWSSARG